jgi:hypothetical protein
MHCAVDKLTCWVLRGLQVNPVDLEHVRDQPSILGKTWIRVNDYNIQVRFELP